MFLIYWITNAPEYSRVSLKVIIFLLAVLFLTIFHPGEGYTGSAPRYLYLIPEGYIGYAQVNFNVEGAAPLLQEGEYLLIKIPPSGIFNTSSAMKETTKFPYQHDIFFYYAGSGARSPMNYPSCGGGHTRARTDKREISWIFFIGTCSDFEKLKDRILRPGGNNIIGPQTIR